MTHFDACTGIGGFHIAAEWAGFQTLGFAEIDPYCCQLLTERWPQIRNYGDIREPDRFRELAGRVTVFSAGVPCQPASLAGKRRGKEDDRWLWPAAIEIIRLIQPTWLLLENPDGIVALDEFQGVLLHLASLGYQIRLFSLPANSVGAKHRRYRTFIVAVADAERERSQWRQSGRSTTSGTGTSAESERTSSDADVMADSARSGRDRRWQSDPARSECDGRPLESAGCGEADGDAGQAGLQEWPTEEQQGTRTQERWDAFGANGVRLSDCDGKSEPLFRRAIDALSEGLDRNPGHWPLTEAPLCQGKVKNRAQRLKALGNACVPAQVAPFFQAIYEVETGCRGHE